GRGGAWFFLLLRLLPVGLAAPFAQRLDRGHLFECSLDAGLAFPRSTFSGRHDPAVAGLWIVGCFLLQSLQQPLRLLELLVQLLASSERLRAGRRTHPHSILCYLIKVDYSGDRESGDVLAQQSLEQVRMRGAEVGKSVIVHAHPAAKPAIDVVALAQPRQAPRTSDPFARRVKPQRLLFFFFKQKTAYDIGQLEIPPRGYDARQRSWYLDARKAN